MRIKEFNSRRATYSHLNVCWLGLLLVGILGVYSLPAAVTATFQGLGDLPGGLFRSEANAISADGTVVVGFGSSASGGRAVLWTLADGIISLGDLPGGNSSSVANGVSADGTVVVGASSSTSGTEAFRWTLAEGMIGLGDRTPLFVPIFK